MIREAYRSAETKAVENDTEHQPMASDIEMDGEIGNDEAADDFADGLHVNDGSAADIESNQEEEEKPRKTRKIHGETREKIKEYRKSDIKEDRKSDINSEGERLTPPCTRFLILQHLTTIVIKDEPSSGNPSGINPSSDAVR